MSDVMVEQQDAKALVIPATFQDLVGKSEIPAATMYNALTALKLLGVECSYDVLHDRRYIFGQVLGSQVGQVSDDVCLLFRKCCRRQFKFDPGVNAAWDAINLMCRMHSFNPVLDYLDGLVWDGVSRTGTWLRDYTQAPDTPFVNHVGEMVLVASVRRMKRPGCKYDYMTVLESGQGKQKSKALAALYGEDNFTDQQLLGVTDKQLQEGLRGRWGVEHAELAGLPRAQIEQVKAQLTRQVDRARPAYGRSVLDIARTCVFWGSTNDPNYLRDQTGNRRFLPIPVGRIDVEAILRDRDQLWAEAVWLEDMGFDIALPKSLWEAAGNEQAKRMRSDPWDDIVARDIDDARDHAIMASLTYYQIVTTREGIKEERITSEYLLAEILGIAKDKLSPDQSSRLGYVMRRLGWEGPTQLRVGSRSCAGYRRKLV